MDGIVTTIVDYPLSVHRGPVESLVPVKSIFYVSNQRVEKACPGEEMKAVFSV